jgi:hypothetical protein
MTEERQPVRRPWPTWAQLVSVLPVGVAVILFVAIRWPWDLAVIVAVAAYAWLLTALVRRNRRRGLLRETVFVFGFLFVALFTVLAGYAAASLPQPWLPLPVLGGLAVATVIAGALAVWRPSD